MAKKVQAYIKLQVGAGKANPSPPVGPALGQHGVNIMEFCKAFNAETQDLEPGLPIPVVITVYGDRSFTFIKKTPPAAVLLRKVAGIKSGRIICPGSMSRCFDAVECDEAVVGGQHHRSQADLARTAPGADHDRDRFARPEQTARILHVDHVGIRFQ